MTGNVLSDGVIMDEVGIGCACEGIGILLLPNVDTTEVGTTSDEVISISRVWEFEGDIDSLDIMTGSENVGVGVKPPVIGILKEVKEED